jgi:hypothetical protein
MDYKRKYYKYKYKYLKLCNQNGGFKNKTFEIIEFNVTNLTIKLVESKKNNLLYGNYKLMIDSIFLDNVVDVTIIYKIELFVYVKMQFKKVKFTKEHDTYILFFSDIDFIEKIGIVYNDEEHINVENVNIKNFTNNNFLNFDVKNDNIKNIIDFCIISYNHLDNLKIDTSVLKFINILTCNKNIQKI